MVDYTTFGLDNDGQRNSTSYPGTTVMTATLDPFERPTEVKTVHWLDGDLGPVLQLRTGRGWGQ